MEEVSAASCMVKAKGSESTEGNSPRRVCSNVQTSFSSVLSAAKPGCVSGWKNVCPAGKMMCVRLEKSDLFDDEVERHMLQKAGLLLEVQAGEGMGI